MEKVMVVVWQPPEMNRMEFRTHLLELVGLPLATTGTHGVRIQVVDDEVLVDGNPAATVRTTLDGPIGAVVSMWVDSSVHDWVDPYIQIIASYFDRYEAYVVSESDPLRPWGPLVNPPSLEEDPVPVRVDGFTQIAFLQRPATLTFDEWLTRWHRHTQVAIDTQSTTAYRQNLVVRCLTDGPPFAAIVEETFPIEALTSWHAFYDADDDDELGRRVTEMIDSTSSFIDLDGGLDVAIMSEYEVLATPW